MSFVTRVQQMFTASIAIKQLAGSELVESIVQAATYMVTCLKDGGKLLTCGNGGSAADAEHFVAELVNRFLLERKELPALALTANMPLISAIANDYAFTEVFAKQVKALGNPGDVLLAISTSGNSPNVVQAVKMAQQQGMRVIALTGQQGGMLRSLLTTNDLELCVTGNEVPRIQEVHILIIHCLCALIEEMLFLKDNV